MSFLNLSQYLNKPWKRSVSSNLCHCFEWGATPWRVCEWQYFRIHPEWKCWAHLISISCCDHIQTNPITTKLMNGKSSVHKCQLTLFNILPVRPVVGAIHPPTSSSPAMLLLHKVCIGQRTIIISTKWHSKKCWMLGSLVRQNIIFTEMSHVILRICPLAVRNIWPKHAFHVICFTLCCVIQRHVMLECICARTTVASNRTFICRAWSS